MAAPATGGQRRTRLKDMQIGDYIQCSWAAAGSGVAPTFSELGTSTKSDGDLYTGNVQGSAGFYLVKVDKGLLIADRMLQKSISWDALNAAGYIQGKPTFFHSIVATGLAYNTSAVAQLCPVSHNNELYLFWRETKTGGNLLRGKKQLPDGSWVSVDGDVGLNYDTTKNASEPRAISFNGSLYLFWLESTGTNNVIRYKVLTDGSWVSVSEVLNYDPTKAVGTYHAQLVDGFIFVSWNETGSGVRVKSLRGGLWVSEDNGGLNFNVAQTSYNPCVVSYLGQLYAVWTEFNGTNNILRCKKRQADGVWVTAESGTGLNYVSTNNASIPRAVVFNGSLFVFWLETTTIGQLRHRRLTGSTWSTENTPLNYDSAVAVSKIIPINVGGKLILYFSEQVSGYLITRAKATFDGLNWISADGGGMSTPAVASANQNAIAHNGDAFITWNEGTNIIVATNSATVLIRSLTGGVSYTDASGNPSNLTNNGLGAAPTTNEWDTYIVKSDLGGKITPCDNNVWHLFNGSSIWNWCQDTPAIAVGNNTNRVTRGGTTATNSQLLFNFSGSADVVASLGFRPVFEFDEEGGSLWQ